MKLNIVARSSLALAIGVAAGCAHRESEGDARAEVERHVAAADAKPSAGTPAEAKAYDPSGGAASASTTTMGGRSITGSTAAADAKPAGEAPMKKPADGAPALTSEPKTEPLPVTRKEEPAMPKTWNSPPPMTIDVNKTYTATIETTAGTITATLYPKDAPGHVNSFVFLSKQGFYDGVIFHRVIPGFMIQGGDPTGTGTGGPGYQLKAEFNARKHKRGVLSAARTNDPNSAGSQFFLMHADSPHLDGQYTAFGEVTSGMDVVDKIANAPKDRNDRPNNPTKIVKVTIDEK